MHCFQLSLADCDVGRAVLFSGCRLVEDLRLLQANLESEEPDMRCSASQDVKRCRALSVWVTMAATSAKRSLRNSCSIVFVCACGILRLNRLPQVGSGCTHHRHRQGLFLTCLNIMLKNMLNIVGARIQPCFTPLSVGKCSDRSLFNLISHS